jgi:predicted  nucleic acid-binding Zn-ribbon protein
MYRFRVNAKVAPLAHSITGLLQENGVLTDRVKQLEAECRALHVQVDSLTSELKIKGETVTELSAGVHSGLNTKLLSDYEKLISINAESTRTYTEAMQLASDTIAQQSEYIENLNKQATTQSTEIKSLKMKISQSNETFLKIQDRLTCPITGQLFDQPRVSVYGHTYEVHHISVWLAWKQICPVTKQNLSTSQLYRNRVVQDICDIIRESSVNKL